MDEIGNTIKYNVYKHFYIRRVITMEVVLICSAFIGVALLCYLFYVLFKGENL
jgi:K+-transporting ATPase KdpF subunit